MKAVFAVLGLLVLSAPAVANDKPAADCKAKGPLNYICNVAAPEDLALLPGGKWMATSGMAVGSGLHLVNLKTKTAERWMPTPMAAATAPYQACPSPPVLDEFQAHGISVRDRGDGHATLYVVNHGGKVAPNFITAPPGAREAIEVFDIDTNGAKPTLTWLGCVPTPIGLVANSVISMKDGTIFTTVVLHPGMDFADYNTTWPTGSVYRWRPGDAGFRHVWGSELTANNGIELSKDEKQLYVISKDGLNLFTNEFPAKFIQRISLEGAGDNVHWVDGKLIIGGVKASTDPACAEALKAMSGLLGDKCIPGYFAAEVDVENLKAKTLATGPGLDYIGVASALVIGKTLWLGSFHADRIAYRTLP
jgi:hypothetical protein